MTPFTDRAGRFSALKTLTLAGLASPALWLLYRTVIHDLGPLPIKEALLFCGLWTVRFLVITLALTPAQRFLNLPRLALVRRMCGVATFAYGLTHFSLYVAMVKFNLVFVASEIVQRYYLAIGFTALLGLSALAATSTDAMVRRLGKRWKMLHRLVYGIAVLGILHFFMWSKIDASQATLMAGLFLTLMIYRLLIRRRFSPSIPILAAAAAAGAVATAVLEFAWYGLTSGVDPWRIVLANLMLAYGPRPAVWVLLAGLAVALVGLGFRLAGRGAPALRPRAA
ncbi:MAG: sulfoxide reductase heme-binding subunit YedZ [Rhizobiales bacterium]|nr:sulfoxide reductase heme-binding subunit YedZ [Hyphomicrobiales bacterium]